MSNVTESVERNLVTKLKSNQNNYCYSKNQQLNFASRSNADGVVYTLLVILPVIYFFQLLLAIATAIYCLRYRGNSGNLFNLCLFIFV